MESKIESLIPRYLNCVKVYSDSNDIIEAANELYKIDSKSTLSKRN